MVRLGSRLLTLVALLALIGPAAMGQGFVVTNTNDSGAGSLRDVIVQRNAFISAGPGITFAISGCSGSCVISLTSGPLPALISPAGGYSIDGKTQTTAFPGTDVVIDGSALTSGDGFTLNGFGHTLDSLTIRNFANGAGVRLTTNGDGALVTKSSITGNSVGVIADAGLNGATLSLNTISGNASGGVHVLSTATSVKITENSIVGNGGLGIDLGGDGVTPNDGPTDPDPGPNRLQNFPVITSATWDGATYTIGGTVDAPVFAPTVRIEFFGNVTAEPTGVGEGQTYLGFTNVAMSGTGTAAFGPVSFSSATAFAAITATATGPDGCFSPVNTSEFSLFPVLLISKSASPSTVTAGQTLTFDISVTNSGPTAASGGAASGVQVLDVVPAGFVWDGTWTGAGWNCALSGTDVNCVRSAGDLPPGATTVLSLPMTAPTTPGSYTNSATVSATNTVAKTTASASITLANSAPVANADSYAATEDTVLTVNAASGVLANDTDVNGQALTASLATGPASGTLSLSGDGSFTYTPNANFFGTDTFTYTASDGSASSTAATVTITVTGVADPPVANADSYSGTEDTPLTVAAPGVLANDADPDGDSLSATLVSGPASGTLSFNADGSFTYTPNANFNGSDSFSYEATDGTNVSNLATVTLTVAAANDAPVAVNDSATTNEDTPVTIAVLSNDTDPEGTTLSVSGNSAAANGTVSCTASSCTYTPNANFNGTDSFTYTITDGSLTSTATVTVTVTAVNDPPTAAPDSASTTADAPVAINVLANDSDVEGGTLSVTAWTNGSLGTVSCTPAGACTYTPSGTTGIDTFTYTVSDGAGGTSTGTVTVTVGQVPCPTTVSGLSPATGTQAGPSGTLSWSGGAGATLFRVYLGPAGSGCQTLFGTTSARQLAYSGLAPGEYDWKVVAEKPGCTTPPQSVCVRFRVCPNAGPTLNAPAAGAQTTPNTQFSWSSIPGALRYHLIITSPTLGSQELAVIPQPAPPVPSTISTTVNVPLGTFTWQVIADFAVGCPSIPSAGRSVTVVQDCPSGTPEPLSPLEGAVVDATPVTFRWAAVPGALRYELFLSINGGTFQSAGRVEGTEASPSLAADVPAGAALSWRVDALLPEGCGTSSSRVVQVNVSCFPPVLSLQGEVTTDKPYQVRATIVSVGQQYLFEESASENFTTVLASKQGEVDPTGEFVFAMFEHSVTEPRAFYYRVRLAQQGCAFSRPGRIVVIPLPPPTATEVATVVQFGNEEEIRQELFIPSPTPQSATSYTFTATTDREWMRVEPAGGTIGQAGVTVTVITNPTGLPVGSNGGTVILTFVEVASGKTALATTPVTGSKKVSVTLVTPVTNKGKGEPGPESLIIPAVAHATGVNSEWQTDLRLLNLGTSKQKYALNLTVSGQDGTQTGKSSEIELASGQNSALNDVVKQWYGLGSLPGESATGVLEIRPLGASGAGKDAQAIPVTRSLSSLASSRTYNKTPQGTLGEYIPAIPFASFVGGETPTGGEKSILSLQQLAQSAAYRTNLGVVEASGKPVNVEIRFFDEAGTRLLTVPLSLKAGEHRQLNQVLATNGLTNVSSARAEVEIMSGDGKINAYASVVDNVTGDPLQVHAVDLAKIGARKYVLPGIAHFDTGQARWRSDVQIFNAGPAGSTATISFFPTGASTASQTTTVPIGPRTMRTLSDIVPSLFGQTNTGGAIQITTATNSELVITGRTYDQRESGSYGQFMAAVTEDDAIGLGDRGLQVLQLEESSNIRTNLGLVEVTGKTVRVELSAFPAESRVTPKLELTLQPNEFRQLNSVLKTLNTGTTYNARVTLRVVGGDGKIVAYGSAVDNLTQDPTYIPGQ